MSDTLDMTIFNELWNVLSDSDPHVINAVAEDETGWGDLREALLEVSDGEIEDVAIVLNSVLDGMSDTDLDWITSDGPGGDGAPNPATFVAILVQEAHDADVGTDGMPE